MSGFSPANSGIFSSKVIDLLYKASMLAKNEFLYFRLTTLLLWCTRKVRSSPPCIDFLGIIQLDPLVGLGLEIIGQQETQAYNAVTCCVSLTS